MGNKPVQASFCKTTLCLAVDFKKSLYLASETLNFMVLKNKPIFFKPPEPPAERIFILPIGNRSIFVMTTGAEKIENKTVKNIILETFFSETDTLSEISRLIQNSLGNRTNKKTLPTTVEVQLFEFTEKDGLLTENFTYKFGNKYIPVTGEEKNSERSEVSSMQMYFEEKELSTAETIDYINDIFEKNEKKSGYFEPESIKNRVQILKVTPDGYVWLQKEPENNNEDENAFYDFLS